MPVDPDKHMTNLDFAMVLNTIAKSLNNAIMRRDELPSVTSNREIGILKPIRDALIEATQEALKLHEEKNHADTTS